MNSVRAGEDEDAALKKDVMIIAAASNALANDSLALTFNFIRVDNA